MQRSAPPLTGRGARTTRSMARRISDKLPAQTSNLPVLRANAAAGPSRIPAPSAATRTSTRRPGPNLRGLGVALAPPCSTPDRILFGGKRKARASEEARKRSRNSDEGEDGTDNERMAEVVVLPKPGSEDASSALLAFLETPVEEMAVDAPFEDAGGQLESHSNNATPSASPRPAPATPPRQIASSTTPIRSPVRPPVTPKAQTATPPSNGPPTPARELLRARFDANVEEDQDEILNANIQARPPTPPRIAERTARNGYPAWATPKRPSSPKQEDRRVAPRLDLAANRPVHATKTPGRPIFAPRSYTQPTLSFATPRAVKPLPARTPMRASGAVASTPARITIPVPFGGRVGESTRASEGKIVASEAKAASAAENIPASSSAPAALAVLAAAPAALASAPVAAEVSVAPPAIQVTVPEEDAESAVVKIPAVVVSNVPASEVSEPEAAAPAEDLTATPAEPEVATPEDQTATPAEPEVATPTLTGCETTTPQTKRIPLGLGSLPLRRPAGLPSNADAPPTAAPADGAWRRKPSYPSSLGSGPLNRPTSRVVSNPLGLSGPSTPSLSANAPTPRAVSDTATITVSEPTGRNRLSMSLSSSGGGLSSASRNLSALDDAMAKLRVPAKRTSITRDSGTPVPGRRVVSAGKPSMAVFDERPSNLSAPSRISSAPSASVLGEKKNRTSEFESLLSTENAGKFLKGVVAYVDVTTSDGADSSRTFVDMLKTCGARVLTRPTESVTHIVYKDGKATTAAFYRRLDEDRRPHVVGIKWIMRCKQERARLPEADYIVNLDDEDVFQKRRKSMEPKSLAAVNAQRASLPLTKTPGGLTPRAPLLVDPGVVARQCLRYAPKIGSPLKMAFTRCDEDESF